jgi:hypothetical protein
VDYENTIPYSAQQPMPNKTAGCRVRAFFYITAAYCAIQHRFIIHWHTVELYVAGVKNQYNTRVRKPEAEF